VLAAFNLSGDDAVLDVEAFNGARLAMAERNAAGGVLGRNLELLPVDTASEESTTTVTIERALETESDIVAGIGYCDSGFAREAGVSFQRAGLPFVSSGATDPALPSRVGNQMFLAAFGDDAQARAMAEFAYRRLGARRVAIWMNDSHDYTVAVGTYFDEAFTSKGGKVSMHPASGHGHRLTAFIEKLRHAVPPFDAVYGATMPADAVAFMASLRDAGIDVPLLSGDGWDQEPVVAWSKKKSYSDIFFSTHRYVGVETSAMKAFVKAYEQRYGAAPRSAFAALGYDSFGLVADAVERAGKAAPPAIRDALASTTDYEGVVGPITYPPESRVPLKPVAIIRVDRGRPTAIWTSPTSQTRTN